jgi:hypothetical protein
VLFDVYMIWLCACECVHMVIYMLIHQDSWWTYEVCVGKDIRQFHAEPVSEEIGLLDSEADLLTATSSSASPPASASSAAAGSRSPGDSEGAGRQGGASAGASTASKPGPEAAELRGLREKQLSASGGADKGSRKVIATTMVSHRHRFVLTTKISHLCMYECLYA